MLPVMASAGPETRTTARKRKSFTIVFDQEAYSCMDFNDQEMTHGTYAREVAVKLLQIFQRRIIRKVAKVLLEPVFAVSGAGNAAGI